MRPRLARPTLGRRLRIELQVSMDLLDHWLFKDRGDDLELTASLRKLRLLWSKQIATSNVGTQSEVDYQGHLLLRSG